MSGWNHRVIRRVWEDLGEVTFCIHEVYYDEGKPTSCTKTLVAPIGSSIEELEQDMKYFREAFNKPVLNYEDLSEYQPDKQDNPTAT